MAFASSDEIALDFPLELAFEVKKPLFTDAELAPAAAADELARCWFDVKVVLVVLDEPANVDVEADEPGVDPEGCCFCRTLRRLDWFWTAAAALRVTVECKRCVATLGSIFAGGFRNLPVGREPESSSPRDRESEKRPEEKGLPSPNQV